MAEVALPRRIDRRWRALLVPNETHDANELQGPTSEAVRLSGLRRRVCGVALGQDELHLERQLRRAGGDAKDVRLLEDDLFESGQLEVRTHRPRRVYGSPPLRSEVIRAHWPSRGGSRQRQGKWFRVALVARRPG